MNSGRKSVVLLFSLSMIASISSYWEFRQLMQFDSLLLKFHFQFLFIVTLSFFMTVTLVLIRRPFTIAIILILRWLFLIVAGYPLGTNLGIEGLLMIPLLYEIGLHLRRQVLYPILPVCVFSFVYMQRSVTTWGIVRNAPDSLAVFHFLCLGLSFSAFIFFLKSRSETLESQETIIQNLDKTITQLSIANKSFQEHVIVAQEKAERDERNRISREIHDTVGYTMTNLIMMMESATDFSRIDLDKTRTLLTTARRLAGESLEDTRSSLRELRRIGNQKRLGILVINNLIQNFSDATGVHIQVSYGSCPWSFGDPFDEIIYHIIQEGLVNAFRHGQADSIGIHLWCNPTVIHVIIDDNGKGSGDIQLGIGLTGMKEQLNRIGGTLKAGNTLDGFEIKAVLNRTQGAPIE